MMMFDVTTMMKHKLPKATRESRESPSINEPSVFSFSHSRTIFRHWNAQLKTNSKNPSLIKAIYKTFWREYLFLGCIQFSHDILIRLTQPIFLGLLLSYFTPNSTVTRNEAFTYATIIVVMSCIGSVSVNQFIFKAFSNGMQVRLATCSLIYRKSLRLSSTALGHTSVGKVVNLLSNDVSRFDVCSFFVHSMWLAPLLTLIVGIILYMEVGVPGLIGMIVIAIVTPIQSFTGKLTSKFRMQTALRTDERVRLMDEVVNGIAVIKLYAWEKSFKKLIYYARDKELQVIKKSSYIRGLYMTFMLFTTRSALFCTMMAIVLLGNQLTAAKVFVISQYFAIIAQVMSQMFVRGIAEICEALVSIRRMRAFLMYDEQEQLESSSMANHKAEMMMKFNRNGDTVEKEKLIITDQQIPHNVALSIRNLSCRWKTVEESLKSNVKVKKGKNLSDAVRKPSTDPNNFYEADELKLTLNNISLEVSRGSLVGILGHVGAGKSSLLQAILKELPTDSGSIIVSGKVAFASQEPWVFSGSVRQNILFGQPDFDEQRYDEVVEACALKQDFAMFEYGDQTLIGERGSSLSGGQKARVSLARALYRKADLYLLDDPLSAVDAHVGKHLFERCISNKGFLGRQNAAVILVTHQVHFLQKANWAVIMKNGSIERQGRPEDLAKAGVDLMKIAEETEEDNRRRSVSRSVSRSSSVSEDDRRGGVEEKKSIEPNGNVEKVQPKNVEETSKGKVKGNIIWNYMRTGGHPIKLVIAMFLLALTQTIASMSDYFVGYWARQEELRTLSAANNGTNSTSTDVSVTPVDAPLLSSENLVYIGGSLVGALFVIAIIRSIFFYTITVSASRRLHKEAFDGVVSTKMRFFDLNPSGRILNRFSKDFGQIDEWLPKCLLDACQVLLTSFGAVVVTSIVNPIVLIPLAILSVFFIYTQRYYLKTSKNIKRLEGTTRSHAFVHLAATINGLATVRAFGAQEVLKKEFDQHQNLHTGAWFMFISCSQAFGFALDCLCMFFVSCVTFSFLLFETKDFNGASVGLAITQAMALTAWLQWGVRQTAEVLNQMMSVERVLEYSELEKEEKDNVKQAIDKSWPDEGKITYKDVTYRYAEDMQPALREVNFTVESTEKIGIVGRTGVS